MATWIKATELKEIDYKATYFAKWPSGTVIKSTGRFQESDGTFFWNESGYIPVSFKEREQLLILDETPSPIVPLSPLGVEELAKERAVAYSHDGHKIIDFGFNSATDREATHFYNGFLAGHAHRLPERTSDEVREDIENILYSIQNKEGNSHLFTTELCSEAADEIIKSIQGHAIKLEENKGQQGEDTGKVFDLRPVSLKPNRFGRYWCVVKSHPVNYAQSLVGLEYGEDDLGNVGFLQESDDFVVTHWMEGEFPAPSPNSPSLPEGIVESLIAANPYKPDDEYYGIAEVAWAKCCSKLRELISSQPKELTHHEALKSLGVPEEDFCKVCEDGAYRDGKCFNCGHVYSTPQTGAEQMLVEGLSKLDTYGWKPDGMKDNPKDVPIEDVFVLRSEVLQILASFTKSKEEQEDQFGTLQDMYNESREYVKNLEKERSEIWESACKKVLSDIRVTFLNPDNLKKADSSSDRQVFQGIGETILNFPLPDFNKPLPHPEAWDIK